MARTTLCGSPASATLRNREAGREDVQEMMVPLGLDHCECQRGAWSSSSAAALLRHCGCSLDDLLMLSVLLAALQNTNGGGRKKQQPVTLLGVISGDTGPDKQLAQSHANRGGCKLPYHLVPTKRL